MVDDSEIEKFVENELKKDISQEESVDNKQVEQSMNEMAFFWDCARNKFEKDSICYVTKRKLDLKKEKMHILQANNVEEGVVAFVSLCEEEYQKILSDKNAVPNINNVDDSPSISN